MVSEASASARYVEAFLAAARGRDLGGLLAVLAPTWCAGQTWPCLPPGEPAEIRGASTVARNTLVH